MQDIYKPRAIKVMDPILDTESRKPFALICGGVETTERTFTTTTFSESSVQFAVPPPNPTTFVSRRFMLKMDVTLTIPCTNNSGGDSFCLNANKDAFRQYPLASIMKNLDVTINGSSVSINMNDVIKPLLLYHNNDRNLGGREMSLSPALRDQSQVYQALVNSTRNPLAGYYDGADYLGVLARGAFPFEVLANPQIADTTTGNAIIKATICEELFLSPLLFGGVRDEGFIGVQAIDINIVWDSNKNLMWSHAGDSIALGNISVEFSNPTMLFKYVTPPYNMSLPKSIQYSYNEIQRYPTNTGQNFDHLQSHEVQTNNIQINAIPRFLYIFVRRNDSDMNSSTPDAYFSIDQISLNWNNKNALLANASKQQLYDISRKNGVDLTWSEWSGEPMKTLNGDPDDGFISGVGSVLCLEFGTDIGLFEDEAPGIIGTYNIQIKMNVTNYSGETINNPRIYLITVIPGIFTIYDNSASKRIGVVTRQNVVGAKPSKYITYDTTKESLMSGGFKFKKAARYALRIAKKAAPIVPKKYRKAYKRGVSALRLLPGMKRKKKKDRRPKGVLAISGTSAVGGRKRRKRRKKK